MSLAKGCVEELVVETDVDKNTVLAAFRASSRVLKGFSLSSYEAFGELPS